MNYVTSVSREPGKDIDGEAPLEMKKASHMADLFDTRPNVNDILDHFYQKSNKN